MRKRVWIGCVAALLAGACGDGASDGVDSEHVASADGAIINGTPDTTHQAVVMVYGNNSACSGTIIARNGSTAYVLTAAHCGNPQQVFQGNDYNNPDRVYSVTNYLRHPNWNGTPPTFDFMMVQVTGATASTPVIPAMSPAQDNLQAGTSLRHVGYGKIGAAPGQGTSVRHQILGNINSVNSLLVDYLQPNGGPCSGDSGGPQLTVSGGERVLSVTSAGDQNCNQGGTSGRVSAVYDSFIMPFINNTPPGTLTCDQCTMGATTGQAATCYGAVDACQKDSNCAQLTACFENCGANDQACVNQCAQKHQAGVSVYLKIFDCICDVACKTECDGEPLCQSTGPNPTSSVASTSVTVSSSSSAAATAGSGGAPGATAASSSGVGGAVADDGGRVAGDRAKKKYDGVLLVQQCAAAAGRLPGGRTWLFYAAGLGLLLARRKRRRRPCFGVRL